MYKQYVKYELQSESFCERNYLYKSWKLFQDDIIQKGCLNNFEIKPSESIDIVTCFCKA